MEGNGSQRAPSTAPSARVSIWESVRACGLWGTEVDKAELRRQVVMPLYLRRAVAAAVAAKDEAAGLAAAEEKAEEEGEGAVVAPVVVFVNSKSGGRHGPVLKVRLHELISEEQVFDLSVVKPSDFVHYGLSCLERLADQGDNCAKATREKMRIVVAGGDGTVGWVLGCLSDLYKMKREPVPPTGIIPLGTGNDLARSFGWGGSFPFGWRSAVKRYLSKAATAPICHLDSWQAVILMPEGEIKELPYALKKVEPSDRLEISQENGTELPEKASCYKGVFYNYLSIGMDAQVAYGFHHLRDEKPYLAQGPVANKLIYAGYSCTQGWFCTPCAAGPQLRGLKNILRLYIKKVNCSEWEQVQMPSRSAEKERICELDILTVQCTQTSESGRQGTAAKPLTQKSYSPESPSTRKSEIQCLTAPQPRVRASLGFHSSKHHQHTESPLYLLKNRSTQIGAEELLQLTDDHQTEEEKQWEKAKGGRSSFYPLQEEEAGLDMGPLRPPSQRTPKNSLRVAQPPLFSPPAPILCPSRSSWFCEKPNGPGHHRFSWASGPAKKEAQDSIKIHIFLQQTINTKNNLRQSNLADTLGRFKI